MTVSGRFWQSNIVKYLKSIKLSEVIQRDVKDMKGNEKKKVENDKDKNYLCGFFFNSNDKLKARQPQNIDKDIISKKRRTT